MKTHKRNTKFHFKGSFFGFWVQSCSMSRFQTCETRWCYHDASTSHFWLKIAQKVLFAMPKNPYKLISPQAGRHSEVCDFCLENMIWRYVKILQFESMLLSCATSSLLSNINATTTEWTLVAPFFLPFGSDAAANVTWHHRYQLIYHYHHDRAIIISYPHCPFRPPHIFAHQGRTWHRFSRPWSLHARSSGWRDALATVTAHC